MLDLNDLYNAKDIILLCEIFENRFHCVMNSCLIHKNTFQLANLAIVYKENNQKLYLHFLLKIPLWKLLKKH